MRTIAILGTAGIPAAYGGFETLAENLARYHQANGLPDRLVVYCSATGNREQPRSYLGAELRYIPLAANGFSSIFYDAFSLFSAVLRGTDVILLLGVSGALALPLVRALSRAYIVTNVDGIEWKREKWNGAARWFLRLSERIAVRFSHQVIADNGGILRHVAETYARDCQLIAYGGDHAISAPEAAVAGEILPETYALALCRIEPENNIAMILEAFAAESAMPLVFVGNWNKSPFGRALRQRFGPVAKLHLLDPVYDPGMLWHLRANASLYVHGHSAGGTNPSLVEMMHFGIPILAYDCIFNRLTTEGRALLFSSADELRSLVSTLTQDVAAAIGAGMRDIAQRRYTWEVIGGAYYRVFGDGR